MAPKPEGGFRLISVVHLCTAWWCYRHGQIRVLDLRVWFAVQEMVARRCRTSAAQSRHYTTDELIGLVGKRKTSRARSRLTAMGLLTWSPEAGCLPSQPLSGPIALGVATMLSAGAQPSPHHPCPSGGALSERLRRVVWRS
jgi:hypothetical protein